MRALGRAWWGSLAFAVLALTLAAPASADPPGLPRTYSSIAVETPNPIGGGSFGWGIASADLTGSGHADLLVAQSQTGPGQVFVYDGVSGNLIRTINPPEANPDGTSPTLAFVYVETMPDVGSCPGGTNDQICPNASVGPPDGIPEVIAASRNQQVPAGDDGSGNDTIAPTASDLHEGRAYVLDGATGAVLKRIDMPAADRTQEAQINALTPPLPSTAHVTPAAHFGRVTISPQGMPPCAGSNAENNAVGVGLCPPTPEAIRIGDLNGDSKPDILITARNFVEWAGPATASPAGTSATGSQCAVAGTPGKTCTAGKTWAYSGALIEGSDPRAILDTPMYTIQDPDAQTVGSGEFGGNLYRVGDVGSSSGSATKGGLDGVPDFVVPARNHWYPLNNPDPSMPDVGVAYLFSGADGKLIKRIPDPQPQPRAQFSGSFNGGRAVGDLGVTTVPDILLPSALQNVFSTDDGAAYVFNGDPSAGGGGEGSWQFATLTDPNPHIGGNFGSTFSGVGDLVGGPSAPANEVLLGSFSPFDPSTEQTNQNINNLFIANAETQSILQTIPDPGQSPGSGFGVGAVPMGDLNGDGFLDYGASAYLYNGIVAGQGRAYIIKSDNSSLPAPPPVVAPVGYKAGVCANSIIGTAKSELIRAPRTVAEIGFKIFGRAGNDTIFGGNGSDCIAGEDGNDSLHAGRGNDTILGGKGNDILYGGRGSDRLYGGIGNDWLFAGRGTSLLSGGRGNDLLVGGPAKDKLYGDQGADVLIVGRGKTSVDGGTGNDIIYAVNGRANTVNCGEGNDVAVVQKMDRIENCEHILTSLKPRHGASSFVRRALGELRGVLRMQSVKRARLAR